MENVCKYYKTQFFTEFTNYYRRCAGPLRRHKNDVQRSLNETTLEEFRLYLMKFYQDKNYVFVVKRKILLRKKKMRM